MKGESTIVAVPLCLLLVFFLPFFLMAAANCDVTQPDYRVHDSNSCKETVKNTTNPIMIVFLSFHREKQKELLLRLCVALVSRAD